MSSSILTFSDVAFAFDSARLPLLAGASLQFPAGWTGIVGANGAGKSTLLRLACGRLEQTRERMEASRIAGPARLGIWMPGGFSRRDVLVSLQAGSLPLGADRALTIPGLTMTPRERIAVTGPNGAGKSTLIRHLLERLALPAERVVYVPQELDAGESSRILDTVRRLPRELLGQAMTIVSCLGSRPDRLLESESPSPGEVRKLLLARGIAMEPHLIVLDEPTNHLDLPSIECLERALAECPCALLLVSHDERFLRSLTTRRWELRRLESQGESGSTCLADLR